MTLKCLMGQKIIICHQKMLERLFGVFHDTINLLFYSDALENRLNVDQFDGQFEPARKRMRYSRTENTMRYVLFSTLKNQKSKISPFDTEQLVDLICSHISPEKTSL